MQLHPNLINFTLKALEVINDNAQSDEIYSDDALVSSMTLRPTPNQKKKQQIITNGKEEYESDDMKHEEHSDDEDEDEPSPTTTPQKQSKQEEEQTSRNSVDMDTQSEILSVQQITDVNFKCIQSSHATQSGTSKGKSKTNQDSFICLDSFGPSSLFQLYGVCDGHGPNGHNVSQYAVKHLPQIIADLLTQSMTSDLSIPSILKLSFERIESELNQLQTDNLLDFDINYSGTTATIGLIAGDRLFVANLGDSRTVL